MREGALSRPMAALLRFLTRGPVLREGGDGLVTLQREGAPPHSVTSALVVEALRRGLVDEAGRHVRLTREGRAALRRHLACEGLVSPADTQASVGETAHGVEQAATRSAADPCDEGGFQAQHRIMGERLLVDAGRVVTARVDLAHAPLASLSRLKEKSGAPFLSEEALAAGERLHRDFTRGQMQPRLVMAYTPRLETPTVRASAEGQAVSDSALSARARVARALEALGPDLSGVALDICCFEKGLETVERERQWPVRSAKLLLRVALMTLARHYAPAVPEKPRATHAWATADGRPVRPRNSGR